MQPHAPSGGQLARCLKGTVVALSLVLLTQQVLLSRHLLGDVATPAPRPRVQAFAELREDQPGDAGTAAAEEPPPGSAGEAAGWARDARSVAAEAPPPLSAGEAAARAREARRVVAEARQHEASLNLGDATFPEWYIATIACRHCLPDPDVQTLVDRWDDVPYGPRPLLDERGIPKEPAATVYALWMHRAVGLQCGTADAVPPADHAALIVCYPKQFPQDKGKQYDALRQLPGAEDVLPFSLDVQDTESIEELRRLVADMPEDVRFLFKPVKGAQGRGLKDLRGRRAVLQALEELQLEPPKGSKERKLDYLEKRRCSKYVAQRFVQPYLLEGGFMFSVRVYVALLSFAPLRALYHPGHAKVCMEPYDNPAPGMEKYSWTTNFDLQQRHPRFAQARHAPRTVDLVARDAGLSFLLPKLRSTASLATAALAQYTAKKGWRGLPGRQLLFTLLSYDLMVGRDGGVWFLEANKDSGSKSVPESTLVDLNDGAAGIAARALVRRAAAEDPASAEHLTVADLQGQPKGGEWEYMEFD